MNTPAPAAGLDMLGALPVGLCAYDADGRLVFVNNAYFEIVGLPPNIFRVGSHYESNARLTALHGVYGPGDPERQAREIMSLDWTVPSRRRYRRADGRSFEAHRTPRPEGGIAATVFETTGLTQQREQAERTAANLFQIVSNLRAGLAVFDAERNLVLHNWRFVELLGLAGPNLAPGLPMDAVIEAIVAHADGDHLDASRLAGMCGRSAAGQVAAADNTHRLRSGGRVADIGCDPLSGGGWALTATDVTALAGAEDEANRRAAMLAATVEHMPHGILVFGPDRRVTMVNKNYHTIMEGTPVSVGEHHADIVVRRAHGGEFGPGDPADVIARRFAIDLREPQVRRRRRPNGTVIDVRTAPMPDGGHISVVMDVTALTDAEDEISRAARNTSAMLANMRHGIILWDRERRIVASNKYAETLLQMPPGLLMPGTTLEQTIESAQARGNLGLGGEMTVRAAHLATQDRRQSHADLRFTASGQVLDVRSDPVAGGGFVTTYTDVTEAQQAQVDLKRAKQAAEAANVAKSRFLATVSHELRTPLNAVIGFSDALLHGAEHAQADPKSPLDPARVAEQAGAVHDAGRQLLAIIDNILDVARLDSGGFELLQDHVGLEHLVQSCIRQTATIAKTAQLTVVFEPLENPSGRFADGPPGLLADERRIRQALLHLLTNAVKFTGPAGTIRIIVDVRDEVLRIQVVDTGIGIADEDIARACEPFTQLDADLSRRYQGAGLGLYIAHAIMQAHGGDLRLTSRLGAGTTATLLFPPERLLAPASPEPSVAVEPNPGRSAPILSTKEDA